jgi:hypothetical protein
MKYTTIRDPGMPYGPWSMQTMYSGQKWHIHVNPMSFVWKSFNLKDLMVYTGLLDDSTKQKIEAEEGVISGHAIVGLNEYLEIGPNQMVVLELKLAPNLYPASAQVKVMGDKTRATPPWSGFPEPFDFIPPLEFNNGVLKNPNSQRYCRKAYHIIGYLTSFPGAVGKSLFFETEKISQTLVQSMTQNILVNAFNYEGVPVGYGIPFNAPYIDFDPQQLT